jgi:hypothetical protein
VRAFLCSLERRKQEWIQYYCSPRSITSLKNFVEEFLKHWGPKFQSFEDTYHELLAALWEEDLLGLFEGNEGIDEDLLEEEDFRADA